MHAKNIYHMDFKPANFVIDQWGEVFVIDFSCAIKTQEPLIDGVSGDTRYFSPERLENCRSDKKFDPTKADIWALGMTFLELAEGEYPFDSGSFEQRKQYWDETYFKNKLDIISELKDPNVKSIWIVIKGLFELTPKNRLSVQQALNMPIFTELKLQFASKEEGKQQMKLLKAFTDNTENMGSMSSPLKVHDKNHPKEKSKPHHYIHGSQTKSVDGQIIADGADYQVAPSTQGEKSVEKAANEYFNVPKTSYVKTPSFFANVSVEKQNVLIQEKIIRISLSEEHQLV